jgi:hypothetical protein
MKLDMANDLLYLIYSIPATPTLVFVTITPNDGTEIS